MRPKSIKVFAVPGVLAPRPRHSGRSDAYFGRTTDPKAGSEGRLDHDDLHPLLKMAEEVPSVPLDVFQQACRYVAEGGLRAGDSATAKHCGVAEDAPKTVAK
jgi:hypothetical protein